jgi:hypothetical protein
MAISIEPRPARRFRPPHSAGTQLDVEEHGPSTALPSTLITMGILVVLWVGYTLLGYQTTVNGHVVVFDSLDRLTRAFLVWHNDPQKLAAIGFFYPPLDTMVFLPSAIVKPLATGLVALPLTSGFFAALTVAMLDRTLARCDMNLLLRIPLLIAFAVNPLWLFYSGNGMSEAVYSAFLAIALYFFVSWYVTAEPRFLIGAGLISAVLVLTRYGFIVWAFLLCVLIGVALARRHARRIEVEGSVIAYAAPVIYVLAIWILFNGLIQGDPFGWISAATSTQAVNSTGVSEIAHLSFNDVAKRLLQLNVAVFPLAFLAVPGLVVAFVTQRNDMALWLSSFIVIGIVIMGANALINDREGLLTLRDCFPMMVTAFVGAGWLFRSFIGARMILWALTLAILILGLFTAWHGMRNYPFQSLEQAYTRTLFSGKSQEGTHSIGGYTVGFDPESQMAAWVKQHPLGHDEILTDNSKTFGVILLSGQPPKYFLRVDKGDKKFKEILNNPWGKVDYILTTNSPDTGDITALRYPKAASGGQPGLTPVAATDRYTMLRVAPTAPAGTTTTGGASVTTSKSKSGTTTTKTTTATKTATTTAP